MSRLSFFLFSLVVGLSAALAIRAQANPAAALVILSLAAGFVLWLGSPSGSAWREAVLTDPPGESPAPRRLNGSWFLAGLLLLGTAIFLLEWQQPYYFAQDDALVCELPGILVGCRGLWQGIWPNYNPYSFMGAPLANLGLYSLTYPPIYVAYAIARHLLADEYATLEVFAVLHLAAGYAITFGLMRQLRASGAVATMVALSVVLSGSALIMGRGWHAFVPLVVWLPVLAWGLVRLCQGPVGWWWTLAMGSAIGWTFHAGFPQMSLWVTGFFVIGAALLVGLGEVPCRRALLALPALLVGVGIALPIALPQVRAATSSGPRVMRGEGLPLPDAWVCMLAPYPVGQASHPNLWGTSDRQYMGQLYFFGGLLGALFFANALALLLSLFRGRPWRGQLWCLAALVALVLMEGDSARLWGLLTELPVVGRVNNHPFRLLPFFVLFASIAGGLTLERTLRRSARRWSWEVLLGVGVGAALLYHVSLARPSFYSYSFRPYATLPEEMNALLGADGAPTGRLLAWSPFRSTHPQAGLSLSNALPGVYRLPAFYGYDPVVENAVPYKTAAGYLQETPERAARAYGIRWHLTVRGFGPERCVSPDGYLMEELRPCEEAFRSLKPLQLPRAFESGPILLTELTNVDPLAFIDGHPYLPLPLQMHAGGIDVDAGSAAGRTVIVNFLWRPEMKASVDGVPVPCEADDWLRVRVQVPPGGKKLEVRYAPDWSRGLLLGGLVLLLAIGARFGLARIVGE